MSCNYYIVTNPEDFEQNLVFLDCDGYAYNRTYPANYAGLEFSGISQIINQGTLILELVDPENPIENLPDNPPTQIPTDLPIRYINNIEYGDVYEVSHWISEDVILLDEYGVYYADMAFADYWVYQITNWEIENTTWDEI